MTTFEKWSNRYKNNGCTEKNLQDLVELGELTYDEYVSITGNEIAYDLDDLKAKKIAFIDSYKHVARTYFPYGNCGGIQRFMGEDIDFINITIQGMKMGLVTEVEWKYKGGMYDTVTDVKYFEDMLLIGGMLVSVAFAVEKGIVDHISSIATIEELVAFDEKVAFDSIFEVEMQKVIDSVMAQKQ